MLSMDKLIQKAYGFNETYKKADVCCIGTNSIQISYTKRIPDIYPYESLYQPITNVTIVTGDTEYDHYNGIA